MLVCQLCIEIIVCIDHKIYFILLILSYVAVRDVGAGHVVVNVFLTGCTDYQITPFSSKMSSCYPAPVWVVMVF